MNSKKELEAVKEAIIRVLCPVPPEIDHRCARRWMVMTRAPDKQETAGWEPS